MNRSSLAVSGVILLCIAPFFFTWNRAKHGRLTPAEITAQDYMDVAAIVVLVIAILLLLRALFLNRRIQFSIRDLLWLTLVVGMAVAWRIDHRSYLEKAARQKELLRAKTETLMWVTGELEDRIKADWIKSENPLTCPR